MENFTMGGMDITEILKPQGDCCALGGNYVWDIYLYVIFFFQLIVFLLLFSSTLRDTIAVGITIMCIIADKTYLFGFLKLSDCAINCTEPAIAYHVQHAFLTWVARVIMLALPLILVTQTKNKKAQMLSVLVFVLSLVYAIGRWNFQQRAGYKIPSRRAEISPMEAYQIAQSSMIFLLAGYMIVKRYAIKR
jgi:hypothetical protein